MRTIWMVKSESFLSTAFSLCLSVCFSKKIKVGVIPTSAMSQIKWCLWLQWEVWMGLNHTASSALLCQTGSHNIHTWKRGRWLLQDDWDAWKRTNKKKTPNYYLWCYHIHQYTILKPVALIFIILQMLWKTKLCKRVIAPLAQYLITSMLAALITGKYASFGGWMSYVLLMLRLRVRWSDVDLKLYRSKRNPVSDILWKNI